MPPRSQILLAALLLHHPLLGFSKTAKNENPTRGQLELIPLRSTSRAISLKLLSAWVLKNGQKREPNKSPTGAHPSQKYFYGRFAKITHCFGSQKRAKVRTQRAANKVPPLSEVPLEPFYQNHPLLGFPKTAQSENPTKAQQGAIPLRSTSEAVLLKSPSASVPKNSQK